MQQWAALGLLALASSSSLAGGVTSPPTPPLMSVPTGFVLQRLWLSSATCSGVADQEQFTATGLCVQKLNIAGVPQSSSVVSITFPGAQLAGLMQIVDSAFSSTTCSGNYTSRIVTPQNINRCVALSSTSSAMFEYQAGKTSPDYSVYGYTVTTFGSSAACTLRRPPATETIYNNLACRAETDANGAPTGRYERVTCNSASFSTANFGDASCTKAAAGSTGAGAASTPLGSNCLTAALQATSCLLQVPTLSPTSPPPSPVPSHPPTLTPTVRPTAKPSAFPTIPLNTRAVFYMGSNHSVTDTYAADLTLRGLALPPPPSPPLQTSGASAAAAAAAAAAIALATRWYVTIDVLGTGFASPMQIAGGGTGNVGVSLVVRSDGSVETVLFSNCRPRPLCDASEATGYTTCLANYDVTNLIGGASGSLHLMAFTVGPAVDGMCKRNGDSLFLRVTLSGLHPNPTAAPSIAPPSRLISSADDDDALAQESSSSGGTSAFDIKDVFSQFKVHMFVAFICFAPLATFAFFLLRRKWDLILKTRVRHAGKLGNGQAEVAALPSVYHLGDADIVFHVVLFGGSYVLETFLAVFLVLVGSQMKQQHLSAIGSLLLSARALLLLPNMLVVAAVSGPRALSAHYRALLDQKDLRGGSDLFCVLRLLIFVDATFVRLLPWVRSPWTDSSGGYPGFVMMRFCVYTKILQTIAVLILQITFLALCRADGVSSTGIFVGASLAFTAATLMHCCAAIYFLAEFSRMKKQRTALRLLEAQRPALEHGDVHGGGGGGGAAVLGGLGLTGDVETASASALAAPVTVNPLLGASRVLSDLVPPSAQAPLRLDLDASTPAAAPASVPVPLPAPPLPVPLDVSEPVAVVAPPTTATAKADEAKGVVYGDVEVEEDEDEEDEGEKTDEACRIATVTVAEEASGNVVLGHVELTPVSYPKPLAQPESQQVPPQPQAEPQPELQPMPEQASQSQQLAEPKQRPEPEPEAKPQTVPLPKPEPRVESKDDAPVSVFPGPVLDSSPTSPPSLPSPTTDPVTPVSAAVSAKSGPEPKPERAEEHTENQKPAVAESDAKSVTGGSSPFLTQPDPSQSKPEPVPAAVESEPRHTAAQKAETGACPETGEQNSDGQSHTKRPVSPELELEAEVVASAEDGPVKDKGEGKEKAEANEAAKSTNL